MSSGCQDFGFYGQLDLGDLPNDGDDEDGLVFAGAGWVAGGSSTLTITLNSSESSITVYYGLWIDWNADGDFADADDGFYTGSGVTGSPVDVAVTVDVPSSYGAGSSVYLRLRAAAAPLASGDYQGTIVNGEVEDYQARPCLYRQGRACSWGVTLFSS